MLKKIFKKIEKALSVRQKLAVGLAVLSAIVIAAQSLLPEETDIAATTVMITTMSERSGGSGVVVNNFENESEILTNRHVCEVIQNGG